MDWYLDASDARAVSALRREIAAYLARHADPAHGDVEAAELVIGELLGNVTRHAPGPCWVSLAWSGEAPELAVYDLGPGFDVAAALEGDLEERLLEERGRGLFIVSAAVSSFEAAARSAGGTRVAVTLPVRRRAEPSFEGAGHTGASAHLPALEEASPDGGFGRESFLRALVVEMAQALEHTAGPTIAEEVVSEVGSKVGAQMEAEYRQAKAVVSRLGPGEMAECMVRLKHAIEGDFRVVELTDDRIVFVNTRCPFGDVVRRAPALCRMTSSVFGGIAARNTEGARADVVLEERIAVGDPCCRVTVDLRPSSERPPFAHRYAAR